MNAPVFSDESVDTFPELVDIVQEATELEWTQTTGDLAHAVATQTADHPHLQRFYVAALTIAINSMIDDGLVS